MRKTKDQEHCLIYYMLNFVLVLRNHAETMFSLTSVQMQCLVKVIKYWRFCNTKHCTFFWVRLLLISVICQSLRLVILSKNIRRLKANKLNCNGKKYKSDVFLNWLFHMHILDIQVLRIIRCFTVGFIAKTYRNQLRTIPPTKDKCTAPTRFQSFQIFLPLWYISWGSFNSGFKTRYVNYVFVAFGCATHLS